MSSADPGTRPSPPQARRRLGDVLVDSGLITAEQLEAALEEQRRPGAGRRRLGQVVAELGFASEKDVAECLANLLGLEMIDLSRTVPAPDVVRLLPRQVAERTRVLVLDRNATGLVIAAADPTNVLALDDVKLYTRSLELTVYVATESQIRDQLNRAWALGTDGAKVDGLDGEGDDDDATADAATDNSDDAPIVKLVNQVLADAVRLRASDIHVEVQRDSLRVRYRVDGLLRDVMNAPKRISSAVISRIKIISGLDIAERRVPQDGRTRFVVEGSAIDARISTLPSLHGEKVVIRLLTRGDAVPGLAELGFETEQLDAFRASLAVPQGLVLITGPTGSGKTNTLYSAIAEIRTPEKNIVTLEDPVEVQLPGITQVGVSEKTGMTFSRGLRSILRQDPDIILVGEVRDTETAELALKASLTGHLVLTTLHTNSAVAALTRLVDMGIEPFLVASSLTCAVAQRLVRRPCAGCIEPYSPSDDTLALLGLSRGDLEGATPMHGAGCAECGGTGYRGRVAVYEVLIVDAAMRQVLMKDPSETAITAQALASGMTTLRASAVEKARQGQTTYEEAIRVTHSDHAGDNACPTCDRPVEDGMIVCPWCTTQLDRGICQHCERPLEAEWKICPWCRTAPGAYAPPAATTLSPAQAAAAQAAQTSLTAQLAKAQAKVDAQAQAAEVAAQVAVQVADAQAKADARAEAQAQAEARAQAEAKAQAAAQAAAQAKAQAQAEAQARAQAEAEAKARALAEVQARVQAQAAEAARAAEEALRAAEARAAEAAKAVEAARAASAATAAARPAPAAAIPHQGEAPEVHHDRPEVHFGGLPEGGRRVPPRTSPVD